MRAAGVALIAAAPARMPAALIVAMLLTMHFVVRLRPALATTVETSETSVRARTPTHDIRFAWKDLSTVAIERGPRGHWLLLSDGSRDATVFVGHLDRAALRRVVGERAPASALLTSLK
jgi:hypothetical protein